jgi:hypothetical protein
VSLCAYVLFDIGGTAKLPQGRIETMQL